MEFDVDAVTNNFSAAMFTSTDITISAMDASQIPSYYNQHKWHLNVLLH